MQTRKGREVYHSRVLPILSP